MKITIDPKYKEQLEAPYAPDEEELGGSVETPDNEETDDSSNEYDPEKKGDSSEEEPPETKVPYSRFKTIHRRAKEAEHDREELRERNAELERRLDEIESARHNANTYETQPPKSSDIPDYWVHLYGDSEYSRAAYAEWRALAQSSNPNELREQIMDDIRKEEYAVEREVNANMDNIDDDLYDLESYIGHDLTPQEEYDLLSIMDEYSPKDRYGKYITVFPLERAWEIYELKNQASSNPARTSRNAAAAISGTGSKGEPGYDSSEETVKNFNPKESIRTAASRALRNLGL